MEAGLTDAAPATPDRPPARGGAERWGPSIVVGLFGTVLIAIGWVLEVDPLGLGLVVLIPVGAILAGRHPVLAVLALFVLLGFSGSLLAFTPISPRPTVELLIYALWAGLLWRFLTGDRHRMWLWPGVLLPGLYVALTLLTALLTEPLATGWESFRLAALLMSGLLLVALSPWAREHNREISIAVIAIGVAAGLYALFRFLVGPAAGEEALARTALAGVPQSTELRFYGSQATAQQLAQWSTATLPVVLALALAWRGRMRLLAALAIGLLVFVVIATEVRTAAVAGAAAVVIVLLLFQLCVAFPGGTRLGTNLTAVAAILVIGIGGFGLTVGRSDDRIDRFLRVLSPSEDQSYSTRVESWSDAWPEITEKPLGQGLGSAGVVAARDEFVPLTATNLDSSYLKIGLEQGLVVMALFVAGLVLLGGTLARRAIATRDPTRAALGIGACGTLAATMVLFYAGFHIENLQVLMAWLLIGIGVAQFSILVPDRAEDEPG
jgi:hypothetical protein